MSNAEIATELVIGETTVKPHVARVMMKLGLRDRIKPSSSPTRQASSPPTAADSRRRQGAGPALIARRFASTSAQRCGSVPIGVQTSPIVYAPLLVFGLAFLVLLALGWRYDATPPPPDSGSDEGRGNGPQPPERPVPPVGGVPLPDAAQARLRLRDHGRLSDHTAALTRRSAPEPGRRPVRVAQDI